MHLFFLKLKDRAHYYPRWKSAGRRKEDSLCRASKHRSSLREPKINVPSVRVQLKICCLSPAGVALIREEASHRSVEASRVGERRQERPREREKDGEIGGGMEKDGSPRYQRH